ncbi:AAA domain-containing protein [Infundibulicybe gibba]|nr:AAA domain-containing protein [Infundibulicybe gibba]
MLLSRTLLKSCWLWQTRGCQVILSTLSMLSSSSLIWHLLEVYPVKALLVDEASQIEVGNYVSVCFIGDDKQYVENLESIFEKPHLRKHALFLDTQSIYDEKLNSNPKHPITDSTIACHFIHVPGQEKRTKDSFANPSEGDAALLLAKMLQTMGYKYQLITPYEGQRTAIEMAMQEAGLDWGNKCFTVDSFQGNEEDYIIISLVRSRELGFMRDLRRTNVMLTRCKKGMFIISSQGFIKGLVQNHWLGSWPNM